jgi:hypothetical protein
MKIFPTNNYKIELNDSPEMIIELLKLNTLQSNSLSTVKTDKEFIGRINEKQFEIIGSEVGIGAFVVLRGNFSDRTINAFTEINKPFKVLISLILVLGICGISYNVFKIGLNEALGMILLLAMFILLIQFILLGVFFKSSKLIFGKFSRLLNIN